MTRPDTLAKTANAIIAESLTITNTGISRPRSFKSSMHGRMYASSEQPTAPENSIDVFNNQLQSDTEQNSAFSDQEKHCIIKRPTAKLHSICYRPGSCTKEVCYWIQQQQRKYQIQPKIHLSDRLNSLRELSRVKNKQHKKHYSMITITPPQPFYGPFSGTTRVSQCQKYD